MTTLCEVCMEALAEYENDGCTYICDVCDREGFCERCACPLNHDCETEDK